MSVSGALLLATQFWAEHSVASFLERKLPKHIYLAYSDISVNLFSGSITLSDVDCRIKNRENDITYAKIGMPSLQLKQLSYPSFFYRNAIRLEKLHFNEPQISYNPYAKTTRNKEKSPAIVQLRKTIDIDQIVVHRATFTMLQENGDSLLMHSKGIDFSITGVRTGPKQIRNPLPVVFHSYEMAAESLFLRLNKTENLTLGRMEIKNRTLRIDTLRLNTKYSKKALSKLLTQERDHIGLNINKLTVSAIDFGFVRNDFYLHTGDVELTAPHLYLYRDKKVADNNRIKKMYSALIDDVPIIFRCGAVRWKQGYVQYEEQLPGKKAPGRLFFNAIEGGITGLNNNTVPTDSIVLTTKGALMGSAPTTFSTTFYKNDDKGTFKAKGSIVSLAAARIDLFLRPNLNAKASGSIQNMYFTFGGDRYVSRGTMKMKYTDFKFALLRENGREVNKVLTSLLSIFIDKESKGDGEGYRYGTISAERDATKSFFNYVWNSIKSGILSVLTGNGKKEK